MVTSRPLKPVAHLVEDNPQAFLQAVSARVASLDQTAIRHFPSPDDLTHVSIAELLTSMLEGADEEGRVDESTLEFFRELTEDYARFGFTTSSLLTLGEAVRIELRTLCADLPFETVLFAERAVTAVAKAMSEQAKKLLVDDHPHTIPAHVVEVEKRSRRFSVIRLQADAPLPYLSGQHVPVTTDYLTNAWRFLCPSLPSNEWGQVEFHIQSDVDDISRLLANARPGDQWKIGHGRGDFGQEKKNSGNDLLFIAHGTGLAPLRSFMFELMDQALPPRLHFFVGADYPGELYELMGLWNFAAASPWLSVIPVSTHDKDEWWVQATEASKPPRGLHLHQVGSMSTIVTSYGAWADRDVLIAGPEQWARDTRRALIRRGTPAKNIEVLPF